MMDYITITATFKHETDKAILIEYEDEDIWLPKSMIQSGPTDEPDTEITIEIPDWLAEEKGLV